MKDLPLDFVLDDTMSLAPGATLSGVDAVVVGARISRGGSVDAADAPGTVGSARSWSS